MFNYGQRLEVNTMYGSILQSSVAQRFGCETTEGSKYDPKNLPTLTLGISLKYP